MNFKKLKEQQQPTKNSNLINTAKMIYMVLLNKMIKNTSLNLDRAFNSLISLGSPFHSRTASHLNVDWPIFVLAGMKFKSVESLRILRWSSDLLIKYPCNWCGQLTLCTMLNANSSFKNRHLLSEDSRDSLLRLSWEHVLRFAARIIPMAWFCNLSKRCKLLLPQTPHTIHP